MRIDRRMQFDQRVNVQPQASVRGRGGWSSARAALVAGVVTSALAGAGCTSSPGVRSNADWERGADLGPSKTFSVTRSPLLPADITPKQVELMGVVDATTRSELTRKGYHEASSEQAELIATSYFIKRRRKDVMTSSFTCTASPGYAMTSGGIIKAEALPPCEESVISDVDEGVLLIDLYDRQHRQLVWHGWATARPEPGSPPTQAQVAQVTKEILEHFPPK